MNIAFQDPRWVMVIGMGHASGLRDVPEAMFIRSMLAAFISTMFMFPMFMPGMFIWPRAPATPRRMRPIVLTQDMTLLPLIRKKIVRRSANTARMSACAALRDQSLKMPEGGEKSAKGAVSMAMNKGVLRTVSITGRWIAIA